MTASVAEQTVVAPRLKTRYAEEIKPALLDQFGFDNAMQIPRVVKVVVNMGVGEAARDSKLIDGAVRDLTTIGLQSSVLTVRAGAFSSYG